MSEKKASEQEKLNQTEAQGQVETEVASIEPASRQKITQSPETK